MHQEFIRNKVDVCSSYLYYLKGQGKIIENGETTWTSRKLCNSCKRENEHNPTWL